MNDEELTPTPSTTPVGHQGARIDVEERPAFNVDGFFGLTLSIALIVAGIVTFGLSINESTYYQGTTVNPAMTILGIVLAVAGALGLGSTTIVQPGQTKVVQFFGRYVGTVRKTGLRMVLPFTTRRTVSVRVHNFETHELKVNDADGNPVNIAGIIVWQVADTAKATFAVESFADFVAVQAESALRHVASTHPYDAPAGIESLRGSTDAVAQELAEEVAARIAMAGLEVIEARISSLAYAPEIAHAMLQRQQAKAVIEARELIVEGAVSMVETALARLETDGIVSLDEERKAAMISNLLVVLCGDSRATPVVNAGTLYGG